MTHELEIHAAFYLHLDGADLSVDRLRAAVSSIHGVEITTDVGVSVTFGPTSNWRSVSSTLLAVAKALEGNRSGVLFEEIDASVMMASPVVTSWIFEPETVAALARLGASISVRVLDTSKNKE